MGIFGKSNKSIVQNALKESIKNGSLKPQTKTVTCPRCGRRYTCTFLGPNDSKTCSCGYRIYCNWLLRSFQNLLPQPKLTQKGAYGRPFYVGLSTAT